MTTTRISRRVRSRSGWGARLASDGSWQIGLAGGEPAGKPARTMEEQTGQCRSLRDLAIRGAPDPSVLLNNRPIKINEIDCPILPPERIDTRTRDAELRYDRAISSGTFCGKQRKIRGAVPVRIFRGARKTKVGQAADRVSSGSNVYNFAAYPELQPIREWGVDAAIYEFGIEADAELVEHLDEAVGTALVLAYAPIASIARQTARTADRARAAHLAGSARLAERMAMRVAEAAAAVQASGDASAEKMAQAASDAAELVAASVIPGGEAVAVSAAAQVATAVHNAAVAKSSELAHAATLVAEAAARAAAEVIDTADVQNAALKSEVFEAAAAIQAIALNACYQVAIDAAATAAENGFYRKHAGNLTEPCWPSCRSAQDLRF